MPYLSCVVCPHNCGNLGLDNLTSLHLTPSVAHSPLGSGAPCTGSPGMPCHAPQNPPPWEPFVNPNQLPACTPPPRCPPTSPAPCSDGSHSHGSYNKHNRNGTFRRPLRHPQGGNHSMWVMPVGPASGQGVKYIMQERVLRPGLALLYLSW